MRLSVNNMRLRAKILEELIETKTNCLQGAPEGKVRISSCRGTMRPYYIAKDEKNSQGRYMPSKDRNLVAALAQKDYDEKIVRTAADELKTLNILIRKYESGTYEGIYDKLSLPRKQLIVPIMEPDDELRMPLAQKIVLAVLALVVVASIIYFVTGS